MAPRSGWRTGILFYNGRPLVADPRHPLGPDQARHRLPRGILGLKGGGSSRHPWHSVALFIF